MSEPEKPQRTIDERIDALTWNVQLISDMLRDSLARMDRADKRERQARQAMLAGITAYLKALNSDEDEPGH